MRILLVLICFVIVAGCDPVSEKPPDSTQGPPIALDGPKIVPNHIGSPEWDKAHQPDARSRIKTIPVQPNPGVTLKPIPTKPDPSFRMRAEPQRDPPVPPN